MAPNWGWITKFQLHIVWRKLFSCIYFLDERSKYFRYYICILSVWNGANISVAYCLYEMGQICWLDHCQVQMTSCHANPDGGEEGGTESGEAIPKIWDVLISTKISKYEIQKQKVLSFQFLYSISNPIAKFWLCWHHRWLVRKYVCWLKSHPYQCLSYYVLMLPKDVRYISNIR